MLICFMNGEVKHENASPLVIDNKQSISSILLNAILDFIYL